MEADQLIQVMREAGAVERCHTLPHHGSYTVGQHCYDALSLLLLLHPDPSLALIKATLWHDFPERWTGDVPAVIKWRDPNLHNALERAEGRILAETFGTLHPWAELSFSDRCWIKAVDALELFLWCGDQLRLGNENARVVMSNLAGIRGADWLPAPVVRYWSSLPPVRSRFPDALEPLAEAV
jgi:5'-deoxynucleotidase YfbR-like HD superfamily hydrolase